jgi:hypothetical protein
MAIYATDRVDATEKGFGNLIAGLAPAVSKGLPPKASATGMQTQSAIIHGFTITTTGSMSVELNPGRAIVGLDNGNRGASFVVNEDIIPLLFSNGDTNNDRIDSIVLTVDLSTSESDKTVEVTIVEGTPSGNPSPPTNIPFNSIVLYNVTVPKNVMFINDSNVSLVTLYASAGFETLHYFETETPTNFPKGWQSPFGLARQKYYPYKDKLIRKIDLSLSLYYGKTTAGSPPNLSFSSGQKFEFKNFFPKEILGMTFTPENSNTPPSTGNTAPNVFVKHQGFDAFKDFWLRVDTSGGGIEATAQESGLFTGNQSNVIAANFTYFLKEENYSDALDK